MREPWLARPGYIRVAQRRYALNVSVRKLKSAIFRSCHSEERRCWMLFSSTGVTKNLSNRNRSEIRRRRKEHRLLGMTFQKDISISDQYTRVVSERSP